MARFFDVRYFMLTLLYQSPDSCILVKVMNTLRTILIRNAHSHDFGGGERFPVFVAEILKNIGHEPHIVSQNPKLLDYAREKNIPVTRGWWWSNQQWSGARVVLFPVYALWQTALYFWYKKQFMALTPDVVHIQSKDDFIAATYAAKACGARVVWTDHADLKHVWLNLQHPIKNPIGKWIYRAAKKADAITVVSESEYQEVTAHLPTTSRILPKIHVVYNGTSDIYAHYEAVPLSETFTFCSINRLVTDKGIGEAIEAFAKIQRDYPNTQLVLVGNGPEEELFQQQAANIPGIHFAGYQTDPLAYVAASHVVLQPTYHEGFSVALVEASMMKKPIIATNVGGNREIIHDHQTGLLVPAKDVDALYAAMRMLIEDAQLRATLGENARRLYEEKFVFDTIVKERFMPLYEKTTD